MFGQFDICCTFDTKYQDSRDSLWRTKDYSKNGIHALLADGSTTARFPTWNAECAKYTFNTSYMTLSRADDLGGKILNKMGSAQNETYVFYLNPVICSIYYQYLIASNSESATSRFYCRINDTNAIAMSGNNAAGTSESLISNPISSHHGQSILIVCVREPAHSTKKQRIYLNNMEWANDNDTLLDCSSTSVEKILGRNSVDDLYLRAGTGLSFFGYTRQAWGLTQAQALWRYFRRNI